MKKALFLFLLIFIVASCNGIKQISLTNEEFYSISEVSDKIDKYNVYVHGGSTTYRLDHPTFEQDSLKGQLIEVGSEEFIENPVKPMEFNKAKKDIHVYLKGSEKEITESLANQNTKKTALSRAAVKEVKMIARDERDAFAAVGLVLLITILGIVLISLIILAFANAADDSSDGSNSNSNSGDSGGSDSGGSNSDSGCYIATMVYGSYDAPKVMVLRAFRDRFLAKYSWGNKFIAWYYANSPKFVEKHKSNRVLGTCIRILLNAVVWLLKPLFKA